MPRSSRSPLILGVVLVGAALMPATPARAAISAKPVHTERHAGGIVVRQERVTIDGRTSDVTTVTMPKPGRGRALEPYLPDGELDEGTDTTSSFSGYLDRYGTAVAINADLFEYASGQPSGLLMLDGEMFNQPQGGRPALHVGLDGMLGMSTPRSAGTLRLANGRRVPFEVNVRRDDGVVTYDRGWGRRTPAGARRTVLARLTGAEIFQLRREWRLRATMKVIHNGTVSNAIPPDENPNMLFQAFGRTAAKLAAAKRGSKISIRYEIAPLPGDVRQAVGGGPMLVKDGKLVYERAKYREFSDSQLVPPDARTAVAQMPDGRVVFYAVDQHGSSAGFTVPQVARDLKRRGVKTAMAFDSGGSTAVSVDGKLLNQPSDGYERPVGNMLVYFRAKKHLREPIAAVHAGDPPAGRRLAKLSYTLKRPGGVDVFVHAPSGQSWLLQDGRRSKGEHRVRIPRSVLQAGTWKLEVAVPNAQDRVIKTFTVAEKAEPAAEEATQATGDEQSADPASPTAADDGDGHGDGASRAGWIAAGAAILLLAGGALLLVRRRRTP